MEDEDPANSEPTVQNSTPWRKGTCCCYDSLRRRAYLDVYGLSLSLFCIFSAYQSVQNLQSSVNAKGGLGVVTLAVLYGAFGVSGLTSTSVIKVLGSKYAIMGALVCHLVYIVSNYYSSWYTLVPASALLGLASGPLWAGVSAHITLTAVNLSTLINEKADLLISQFTGVLFMFTQLSYVPGNLASSLIFMKSANVDGQNGDVDGDNASCQGGLNGSVALETKSSEWYILVSVFVTFEIISIVILTLVVGQVHKEVPFFASERKFKLFVQDPVISTFRMFYQWKLILIGFMFVLGGLTQSFAFSVFAKQYVSDCFDVSRVGLALIVLGVANAFTSAIVGKAVKYVPRMSIVIFTGLVNIGLAIFLLLWKRVPSYVMVFLFSFGWGFCNGVWNTISSSLVGILYPKESESAYSVARMWQALGFTIGLVISYQFSTSVFLYTILGNVLISVVLYLILELRTQTMVQTFPCLALFSRQKATEVEDEEHLFPT